MSDSALPPAPPSPKRKPRRRWLQFSLRTLMLITLLFAVFFSWLAVEIRKAQDEARAVTAIRAIGGEVCYDHELPTGRGIQPPEPPGPKWLRRILGDRFFFRVYSVHYPPRATDADLEYLDGIRHLVVLDIGGSTTSPAGRARIWNRHELAYLNLRSNSITDEEIAQAAALTKLEFLDLSNTPVTDRVVDTLQRLPSLNFWILDGTLVSDSTIEWTVESYQRPNIPRFDLPNASAPSEEQLHAAATIERAGGTVKALRSEGGGEVYYDVDWSNFSVWKHFRSNDELIRSLHQLKDLQTLTICDAYLDGEDWKHLANPTAPIRKAVLDGRYPGRPPGLSDLTTLVISTDSATDDAMQCLKQLHSLRILSVASEQVTDAGLLHVGQMASLENLTIGGTKFTDAGMVHIAKLRNLTWLDLSDTELSDTGLAHLAKLTNLELLQVNNTKITEAGLIHLEQLEALWTVYASGTDLSPEIQEALLSHGSRFREATEE